MTVGELAGLFNREFVEPQQGAPCELQVVRMQGWRREMTFADTGLPWVAPSPNMPTPATALVYAGTGLLEGTNVSEGRGSCTPFELVGAPWMDRRLAETMRAMAAEGTTRGVSFREAYFTPTFGKYQGKAVAGVQLHVWHVARFEAVRTALALLTAIKALYPEFEWRPPAGEEAPCPVSCMLSLRSVRYTHLRLCVRVRTQPTRGRASQEGGISWIC